MGNLRFGVLLMGLLPWSTFQFGASRSLHHSIKTRLYANEDSSKEDAAMRASYRKSSDFDGDLLRRPGMESWMFDENNNLKGNQITFDWKEVPFRDDQLGGYNPDLTPRNVDASEAALLSRLQQVFGNTIEVLEASQGVYRFKYHGPIKNQIGMEAWALDILKEYHPQPKTIKECSFLTNRKRDTLFGENL